MDPNIPHGVPCIRGTRVPVSIIVGSMADGMSAEDVGTAYPELTLENVRAALAYAAETLRRDVILPLAG